MRALILVALTAPGRRRQRTIIAPGREEEACSEQIVIGKDEQLIGPNLVIIHDQHKSWGGMYQKLKRAKFDLYTSIRSAAFKAFPCTVNSVKNQKVGIILHWLDKIKFLNHP